MATLKDKEEEIEMAKNEISRYTSLESSSVSQTKVNEMETQLQQVTESLLQKQGLLEAITAEKTSLVLKIERLEVNWWNIFLHMTSSHNMHSNFKFWPCDPLGLDFSGRWLDILIVSAGSDHCFSHMSVPNFQNLVKYNKFQVKTIFATGETVCLAEWTKGSLGNLVY